MDRSSTSVRDEAGDRGVGTHQHGTDADEVVVVAIVARQVGPFFTPPARPVWPRYPHGRLVSAHLQLDF